MSSLSHKQRALSWATIINRPYKKVNINWIGWLAGSSYNKQHFDCVFVFFHCDVCYNISCILTFCLPCNNMKKHKSSKGMTHNVIHEGNNSGSMRTATKLTNLATCWMRSCALLRSLHLIQLLTSDWKPVYWLLATEKAQTVCVHRQCSLSCMCF